MALDGCFTIGFILVECDVTVLYQVLCFKCLSCVCRYASIMGSSNGAAVSDGRLRPWLISTPQTSLGGERFVVFHVYHVWCLEEAIRYRWKWVSSERAFFRYTSSSFIRQVKVKWKPIHNLKIRILLWAGCKQEFVNAWMLSEQLLSCVWIVLVIPKTARLNCSS